MDWILLLNSYQESFHWSSQQSNAANTINAMLNDAGKNIVMVRQVLCYLNYCTPSLNVDSLVNMNENISDT